MELLTGELSEIVTMIKEWLLTGQGMLPTLMAQVVAVKLVVLSAWIWIGIIAGIAGILLIPLGVWLANINFDGIGATSITIGMCLFVLGGICLAVSITERIWWQQAPEAQFISWIMEKIN